MSQDKVVVVAGVGPGNGTALARRFAESGRRVAMLARSKARSRPSRRASQAHEDFECDVSDASSVEACFAAVAREFGEVDTLLYNAGTGVFADVESITVEQFEQAWRVNAFWFAPLRTQGHSRDESEGCWRYRLHRRHRIARRGGKMTAAFAPAKAAQRSLAESMARSLWPAGIHVALIVVDGVVDLEKTRAKMPDKPDDFFVDPAGVARDCLAAYAAIAPGVELRD